MIYITQQNLDQYAEFANKETLSTEEQAVRDAIVALSAAEQKAAETVKPVPADLAEANDVLEDSQDALTAKPSKTV